MGEVGIVFDLVEGEIEHRSCEVPKHSCFDRERIPERKAAEAGARGKRYTAEESGAELAAIADSIDAGR